MPTRLKHGMEPSETQSCPNVIQTQYRPANTVVMGCGTHWTAHVLPSCFQHPLVGTSSCRRLVHRGCGDSVYRAVSQRDRSNPQKTPSKVSPRRPHFEPRRREDVYRLFSYPRTRRVPRCRDSLLRSKRKWESSGCSSLLSSALR